MTQASVFPNPDALKEYLRTHPKADPSKHSVRGEGGGSKNKPLKEPSKGVQRPSQDPLYKGKNVTQLSHADQAKIVGELAKRPKGALMGAKSLLKIEQSQAKGDPKKTQELAAMQLHLDTAIQRQTKTARKVAKVVARRYLANLLIDTKHHLPLDGG